MNGSVSVKSWSAAGMPFQLNWMLTIFIRRRSILKSPKERVRTGDQHGFGEHTGQIEKQVIRFDDHPAVIAGEGDLSVVKQTADIPAAGIQEEGNILYIEVFCIHKRHSFVFGLSWNDPPIKFRSKDLPHFSFPAMDVKFWHI